LEGVVTIRSTCSAIVLAATVGCSAPGGIDYPYKNFDLDVERLVDVLKEGDASGFTADQVAISDAKPLWGKVKSAKQTRALHLHMTASYWYDAELTTGQRVRLLIGYWPTGGGVNVSIEVFPPS
jgi:hypothetical protein